ncbi:selenium metabolism-associated LysR family transcriptional regulator [Desulfonema magnum]|uniref:Transcriptional activator protein, LysR family n=1 Tax=Desulfonema magnum TaxID=45655 RepID=A0A975GR78_9BACT|nr:selenium metabolism-associated LysR family transcriptional regulator [Desulfonema magnum]QTA90689.1 Transcriptional activator protein, LysR family [Desulfonema magnum]
MDLWQLHIFCKVTELKSFSKAGKAIHLSQPTVSSHIKYLEEHFGCRLIDRLSKEAVPTKAGELLYEYARKLIALRDEAETAMSEFHGNIRGSLVIGGSTIPGVHILPQIIGAFVRIYPDVTISLIIGDTEKTISDILSGVLELGIVGAETRTKGILQEKLIEDEMQLIVPATHKWARKKNIDLRKLSEEPFIVRESGSGTLKSVRDSLTRAGYSIDALKIIAEMGSTQAVIQGIKNNVGISVLSTIAVSEDLKAGTLKALAIKKLNLRRCFYLTRHKYRTLSPLCQIFMDFIKKELLKSEGCKE